MYNKSKITFVIPCLNEAKEPLNMLKSLYENTDPELFEVILINDGTNQTEWYDPPKKYKNIQVVTHDIRKGVPYCRQLGCEMAQTQFVGVFNARMRFTPGWLEKVLEYLEREPKTLYCTTSVVLWDMTAKEVKEMAAKEKDSKYIEDLLVHAERIKDIGILDEINDKKERKYGADIVEHYDKDGHELLLDAHWREAEDGNCYEIPCVLGAMYFMGKPWFEYIRGWQGLEMYGGEEEYLSLKTWALGGKVKIIKEVEIGNIYHMVKNYNDSMIDILWNKMFLAFTLLKWDKAMSLLYCIKHSEKWKSYYAMLQDKIIINAERIVSTRNMLKNLTIFDISSKIINL